MAGGVEVDVGVGGIFGLGGEGVSGGVEKGEGGEEEGGLPL